MNIGPPKKFLTDLYVYMNIHYHIDYASTHVHMWTIKTPSYYETMDLGDSSEFKDLTTTSSDEDTPALEDSVYWKDSGLNWTFLYIDTISCFPW